MNKPVFTKVARFKYLSELAASQERNGNYTDAAKTWSQAQGAASKPQNQEWCRSRADFCARVATRQFSKGE